VALQAGRAADSSAPARQALAPELDAFLPSAADLRQALLLELIHADLEFRLEAGEEVRVGRYLSRYPELAAQRPPSWG
jgi:hypothetical protein